MSKSSIQGHCHALYKAVLTLCCLLAVQVYHAVAQAPIYTSSPATTATVGQPYQYSVQANDPNNLPMTFTAGSLPSWLTFSASGQSTSSQFGGTIPAPTGVAGDASGNTYVAQNSGTTIYKIAPDGTMTSWFTRSSGTVYALYVLGNDLLIAYFSTASVNKITKVNLTGTPVETPWITSPAVLNPITMVERNGFLYVADYSSAKLRKIDLATNAVSDVLTLTGIYGLGFNSTGTLYLASYNLRKVSTADVTNVNPQSTLTDVLSFTVPATDVKVDANDYVYVSAPGFVRKYNPNLSAYASSWTGSGTVWGMTLTPGGTLVFGLSGANMVHRLQTGAVLTGTPALGDIGVHNVSLNVSNGTQTTNQNYSISVSGPATIQATPITVPFGTAPITLTDPGSNSGGSFTYTSSNQQVATINGNMLTIAGMGTAIITATQAASGLYLQTQQTFLLTVTAPAPTFGSWPAINKLQNDGPFTLTAPSSNSSGNITYSSSNQQVATINGTTVTITGVGTTTITASQAAHGNYAQGSTTTTLTVGSGVPAIGALSVAAKIYGDQPFTLTDPASNSGGTFTYNSSNQQVATINGNVVTIVGAGSTDITATQAAAGSFNSGSVTATLQVAPAAPAIASWSIPNQTFGAAAFQLSDPVSNSSGTFTYTTSDAAVANVNGNTISILGVGTATITATQAAAGNYTVGSVQAIVSVVPASPVLGNLVVGAKSYGEAPFQMVDPASNSNGQFGYTSSNLAVATISGNTVTIVGAGSTTITAVQAATANYTAGQTTTVVAVAKANPVITTPAAISKVYGDAAFALAAPASNSNGAFTYTSSDNSVANINGNTVTIAGAGSATITATQAATANYNAGVTTFSVTVAKANPVVTTPAAIAKVYGDAAFNLAAPVSNSNGGWTYTSANTNMAAVNGNTATIAGAGNVVVTATQAATANYHAAQTTITINVAKANPAITTPAAISKVYGDAAFALTNPVSNSSGAWSYATSNNTVAAISGNTATIAGAGTATIVATQAATNNYNATQISYTLNVAAANLVIATPAAISKVYGDAAFAITAPQSNSNGGWSYTSANTGVVSVNGNTVIIAGAGTTTITATQAATNNYHAGTATISVTIAKADPVITAPATTSKVYGDAAFALPAPQSNSNGAWSYTATNNGVVAISGNTATIAGAGMATVTATQAATANYNAGTTSFSISVAKANPVVANLSAISKQYGDAVFVFAAPQSNSTGAWSYASSNTSVATINGNSVAIVGAGTASITATQAADANYNAAQVSTTLSVDKAPLTITAASAFRCVNTNNPAFSYTINGFVNGENASVLQSLPLVSTVATPNNSAGTYAITATGAAAANYTISYVRGVLTINNPQHAAQRYATVNAIAGEATPLQARSFGMAYQWAPQTGLNNSRVAMTTATLQKEQPYTIAITEATGCVITDTVLVRTFNKPDVFLPNLFSPNGDGINDELRINPVGIKQLYYFRVLDRNGKVVFETRNLNEGWNGRFRGDLLRLGTYQWILSGRDKSGKWLTTSGSVTLVR